MEKITYFMEINVRRIEWFNELINELEWEKQDKTVLFENNKEIAVYGHEKMMKKTGKNKTFEKEKNKNNY